MSQTARAQALELIAKAQQSLDDALSNGTDTTAPRDRLRAAQAKLGALDASQAPIVDLDAETQLQAEALAMLDAAQIAILAKLAPFQPPAPLSPSLPLAMGLAVIQARRTDAETETAIREHELQGEQLTNRLAAIRAKREAIAARRLAGQGEDEVDSRQLGLIGLDEQGLLTLLARHQANRPLDPCATVSALASWREGVTLAELSAQKALAEGLQRALLACAGDLARKAGARTAFRLRTDPALSRASAIGLF